MKKTLFVGDQVTDNAVHCNVAFIGAKCFPRLESWIREIDPDFYAVVYVNEFMSFSVIQAFYRNGFSVVALGEVAAGALARMEIEHFKLPHPSGLNRKINDKEAVQEVLKSARQYVESKQTA